MMYRLTIGLLLALLGLNACAGQSARPAGQLSLQPFDSSLPDGGARLSRAADTIELRFPALGPDGGFLRLRLPEGRAVAASEWSQREGLLQLVAPLPGGADIGVVPLPGYAQQPLTLTLRLTAAPRAASIPPSGAANALFDLALEQGGAGQVRLSWTEVNRGDYDFNSEVNVADLAPLAKNFRHSYDISAPDVRSQTAFWVDGDGNGEISASDLTTIGKHYGARIAGYNILCNGAALPGADGQQPTVPRSAAQLRTDEQLPPRYIAVAEGSVVDNWSVLPVDGGSNPGDGNPLPPLPVDLSVKFSSTGLALHSLDGSGSAQDAPGRSRLSVVPVAEVMRRIDPGDHVDSIDLGDVLGPTSGNAGFTNLPRDEWLLLQVALAPTVNPATGAAWTYPQDGSAPHYRCLYVPVKLPPGNLAAQLSVSTNWVMQQGGGYKVRISSSLRAGALRMDNYSELDFAAALVAADTNGDLLFSDELRLADPRLAGLSSQRLEQLADDNAYAAGTRQTAAATGRFAELLEAEGYITTSSTQLSLAGAGPVSQGELTARLTEFTAVTEEIISAGATLHREIKPADLRLSDQLRLTGYLLDGIAGLPQRLWITGVTRVIDTTMPDRVYAWPGQTSAYPGEQVTITVSSDRAAAPFYALRGMRVSWNSADYVFDSLNAGAPGGERAASDGIWAQLAPDSLQLPSEFELNIVNLPDGRKALDFYVLPQGGAQIDSEATGALLNFKLSILGDVVLGIERLDSLSVKRSYYSDSTGVEYFWADDNNAGVPLIEIISPGGPEGPP